jgi:hypothetical protein
MSKEHGLETNNTLLSSAEVKKERGYISTLPLCIHNVERKKLLLLDFRGY